MATTSTPKAAPSTALVDLFNRIESHYPSSTLGTEGWYILVFSALTSARKCQLTGDLYKHLISRPEYSTTPARQKLIRRLREALVKLVSVIGVALPLESVIHLSAAIDPQDRDYTFSRETWTNDAANLERGEAWLRRLYAEDIQPLYDMVDSHRDFALITGQITYGFYLSDHTILDGVETELCVLSAVFCLGLPRMVAWHLRGCRRIGIASEDVEKIQQCIEIVAEHCGFRNEGPMPRVKDIEGEVTKPLDVEKMTS